MYSRRLAMMSSGPPSGTATTGTKKSFSAPAQRGEFSSPSTRTSAGWQSFADSSMPGMSLSEGCGKVTGIPYVMRTYRKEAEKILAQ